MATTVIDPNKGTNNAPYGNRVVAIITTDAQDYTAAWDEVIGVVGGSDIKFDLPLVQNYPGKRYSVKLRSTTGGKLIIEAYSVTGSNTIDGAATLSLTLAGQGVILESDGINVWSVVGGYTVGASYTLPAAVAGTLGGTKIVGTPASAGSPTVPVTEADGFIPESVLDLAVIGPTLPAATVSVNGVVEIVGTPPAPTHPVVPVVQASGFIPNSVVDFAGGIVGAESPATDTTLGAVLTQGTPVDPTGPTVPVLTSVNVPINASITTAALVGKTIRVENGIITGFS